MFYGWVIATRKKSRKAKLLRFEKKRRRRGLSNKMECCREPTNEDQKRSLANLPRRLKWPRYEEISTNLDNYFATSCYPITVGAEDDMELISLLFSNEEHCRNWAPGQYRCARCSLSLYGSEDKWRGPCRWASFRTSISKGALFERPVNNYNNYQVRVAELYCSSCFLFIGHSFEDGIEKGDVHPEAKYRH